MDRFEFRGFFAPGGPWSAIGIAQMAELWFCNIDSFELACELHTLKQRIAEYNVELAMAEQDKMLSEMELQERTNILFDPDTGFAEKLEAAMEDMLSGRHTSQSNIPNPDSLKEATDNEENATDDY